MYELTLSPMIHLYKTIFCLFSKIIIYNMIDKYNYIIYIHNIMQIISNVN